ncbi:MAG: helix-turn-helix transcriptional regulator [Deltaproteobacteria bacterium]|nr:helix-turn-helix transcriptional regulator [Deltaproteobacteria bacterium]
MLGGRLRAARKKKGWTLELAAEHVHVHAVHLSRLESGKDVNPTLAVLVSCALAYGVPVTDLLTESAEDGQDRSSVRRRNPRT